MNVAKRTKKLKEKVRIPSRKISKTCSIATQLLDIRIGPGAAIISNDVKRIHLDFAYKINDGHFGARKVWRNYLPRLKYHNPAVSMTVNRTLDQASPATLTIFFAPGSKSSTTASPAPSSSTDPSTAPSDYSPSDRVESIDMKHKHESEILSRLLEVTSAQPYESTPEEVAELKEVEDFKRSSGRDREAQTKLNERRRQEQALLDQARGSTEAA